jgi:hypothetical protein
MLFDICVQPRLLGGVELHATDATLPSLEWWHHVVHVALVPNVSRPSATDARAPPEKQHDGLHRETRYTKPG